METKIKTIVAHPELGKENTFNLFNELKKDEHGFKSFFPKRPFNTREVCLLGLLTALMVVLSYVSIPLGTIKLSIEGVPIYIAGFIFGPVGGIIVGFLGSLLYQLLSYGVTATTLLWILPHVATGFLAGFLGLCLNDEFEIVGELNKLLFVPSVMLINLLATLINTYAIKVDAIMFGYYTETLIVATLAVRLTISAFKGMCYALLIPQVCEKIWRKK